VLGALVFVPRQPLSDDFVAVSFTIFATLPAENTTNEISISCIGRLFGLVPNPNPSPDPGSDSDPDPRAEPNPTQTTGDTLYKTRGPQMIKKITANLSHSSKLLTNCGVA